MRKLQLAIEDIHVETFATIGELPPGAGTVHGHSGYNTCETCNQQINTCQNTCQQLAGTCYGSCTCFDNMCSADCTGLGVECYTNDPEFNDCTGGNPCTNGVNCTDNGCSTLGWHPGQPC
jgi:hypothetical protein